MRVHGPSARRPRGRAEPPPARSASGLPVRPGPGPGLPGPAPKVFGPQTPWPAGTATRAPVHRAQGAGREPDSRSTWREPLGQESQDPGGPPGPRVADGRRLRTGALGERGALVGALWFPVARALIGSRPGPACLRSSSGQAGLIGIAWPEKEWGGGRGT